MKFLVHRFLNWGIQRQSPVQHCKHVEEVAFVTGIQFRYLNENGVLTVAIFPIVP